MSPAADFAGCVVGLASVIIVFAIISAAGFGDIVLAIIAFCVGMTALWLACFVGFRFLASLARIFWRS